jgi:uncharacterized protein
MGSRHLIGLISDTHGLFRPEAATALAGVELILHAGDVGGRAVIEALEQIAPVRAVHGNVDPLTLPHLPPVIELEVGGVSIHVSHGHELGSPRPVTLVERYAADVIVFGHTHRAEVERVGRQLVVNPGAAGAARFHVVPSCARLTIENGEADVRLVPLV